ncbi:carboxylate-amine ligase [Gaiella sp.]|uniref:carboxylate-amine ligase n=1 Tax=Gaiella sp. TaxID=2663207 RepID=UPI002E35BCFB|nr:YbdK family carboxylate-amine ligase [Gaiella sp.]HEX5584949.1 YbdK family carboxylate-amine ligase [Gaiella sp.]
MKPVSGWTAADGTASGLRAMFDAAPLSLTVGAEEELMLVDPGNGRLAAEIEHALRRLGGDSRFQAEFRASQVEVVTRPCLSPADVGRELAVARLELADAIGPELAVLASGSHPTAVDLGPVTTGERYHALARSNPWAERAMLTCGLHIHVGLAGADRALAVYNALRSYLPELAALGANSPFHGGERTGLASTRMQLNRSLTRHGVPPSFPDWRTYAELIAWGHAGGAIPDASYHWWDLRLHPGCGTIELRICDTQTDLDDTIALVALVQALVAWLAERHDAGEELPVHDGYRIAESAWLAAHGGVGGEVLDLASGERHPVAGRVAELLETLEATSHELGTEAELARLERLTRAGGADRQLRAARELGIDRLPARLAADTIASAKRVRARATADATPGRAVASRGRVARLRGVALASPLFLA